jgi:hypothetical protein
VKEISIATGIVETGLHTAVAKLARIAGYRWTQVLDSPFAV